MSDRDGSGQQEENGDAAEEALQDHRTERGSREPANPAPGVDTPRPHDQRDREHADDAGNHPVPVLVEDPTHHLVERERKHEVSVCVRPVGHRQPGIGTGDHSAGSKQQHGAPGQKRGEAVESSHGVAVDPLKVKLNSFESFSASVTFCVCAPSFSCQASTV